MTALDELIFDNARMREAIGEWARARAAMNGVKINTPECAAAFDRLGSAETALAAFSASVTGDFKHLECEPVPVAAT